MTTTPVRPLASEHDAAGVRSAIIWSSFLFALLQSVCTFFAAANGLRFVIGLGSLVLSAAAGAIVDGFHADVLRIPMVIFALVGSLLNLSVVGQVRRLRRRPASQWRQGTPTPNKIRMERLQMILSVATLLLITAEEVLHLRWSGHL